MIKRTPQEIADFFQGYMAKDMSGCWHLYSYKPYIDDTYDQWYEEEREFDYVPFGIISDADNTDWRESLCEPRITNDILDGGPDIKFARILLNMIIADTHKHEYTEDLKQIADHYGQKELLERLLIECAEMGVVVSHSLKDDSIKESLMNGIADLEILLEQVKYLMKLDLVELGVIKREKITVQQWTIAKESHEESANNPQKVHGKSTNEEE